MRAIELIRSILDFIDKETVEPKITMINMNDTPEEESEQIRKQDQIKDLKPSLYDTPTQYSNSPDEKIADIDAVTTGAGGGMSGPKHPADIRGEYGSMFRDYLARAERGEQ